MANPSAAHEPSMEEILASIRQIISEDGEGPEPSRDLNTQGDVEAADGPAEIAAKDVESEFASSFTEEAEAASEQDDEPEADYEPEPALEHDPEPESSLAQGGPMTPQYSSAAAEAEPFASPAPAAARGDDNLLSPQSDTAVHGAFSALAHTILAQNARTLEDLVAEMLQPMLKSWLDENLPTLVEQMVHDEIQRVSRGRR